MDKRIARRWVKALISGKYKQADGKLKDVQINGRDSYCCLGVLCDITRKETGGTWGGTTSRSWGTEQHSDTEFVVGNSGAWALPPERVYDACGLSQDLAHELASMNDERKTFRTIAKRIAKEAGIVVKELQPKPRVKKAV